MEERPPDMEGSCEDIERSRGQPTRGSPPVWLLGKVLTTPHRKIFRCYETFHKAYDFGLALCSVQGQVAGCCERGNGPSLSIKYREFLDWLMAC